MPRALSLYRSLRNSSLARNFSTTLLRDPAKFVQNLSADKIQENAAIVEFLKANYPEAFEQEKDVENAVDASQEILQTTQPHESNKSPSVDDVTESELNIRKLTCYKRDPVLEDGSRRSRTLRDEGMIPGLLYGSDPTLGIFSHLPESKTFIKTPWKYLQRELDRYHRSFESRVYDLTVLESADDDSGGTVHRVLPRNVQRHPVLSTIYCANFCRYHAGRPIKIPLVYINEEESPILKRDGFIVPIQRFVECLVEEGVPIPEKLELECTGLRYKEVIRTNRVLLPEGVRFSDRVIKKGDEFIVGVVFGKNVDTEEEATPAKK